MATQQRQKKTEKAEVTDSHMWGLAGLTFGLGDVATTAYALNNELASEANPLVKGAVQHETLASLIAIKALAIGGSYLVYKHIDHEYNSGIPIGLYGIGILTVANNLSVIGAST